MTCSTPEIAIHQLEAGHVPGARLVPMGQLAARVEELDRSRPVETGAPRA
jgi:rhodanese-related sulfurtransferase